MAIVRPPLPSQEALLLDYVQRLERYRQGRHALQIHLSRLKPFNRREQHVRAAASTFDVLAKALLGQIFVLANSDLMFIYKTEAQAQVDEAVDSVRFLFGDDPLLAEDESGARLISWHDVDADYDAFLDLARRLANGEQVARTPASKPSPPAPDPSDAGAPRPRTAPPPDVAPRVAAAPLAAPSAPPPAPPSLRQQVRPLTPAVLGRVERALERADLDNLLRRQYVCAFQGETPVEAFSELFISIADLRETLLPGVNLASSPWLFHRLTETLDRRVLAMLGKAGNRSITGQVSLNLNVSTLLGTEFLRFDDSITASMRGGIIIELQKADIFADLDAYLFAREYVRERGYRICIDGLTRLTLPFVDRERLGADLIKIVWTPEIAELGADVATALGGAVAAAGEGHVILCRCDDRDAIAFGRGIGIRLFQGRHVENLIAEENRRKSMRQGRKR